ncbi:MAG: L-lactate dehydrogenase [Bacteroidetes bacterium]|jgi:L-lactate dehydrogenase|nr:L-lactate dehydrogenase [Bacteroidota bacterium]
MEHAMNLGRPTSERKIGLVGTGMVGSSFAFALMIRGRASELVLVDANAEKAVGEMMDLVHGLSFARPMKISAGGYEDLAGCHVVVVAAGASQRPGETRLDLLGRNAAIFREILPQVVRHNPDGIILIATNPVDILTYVSLQASGLPASRVIGSGTILDTSRFRSQLGQYYGVDPRSVHAIIIGEHGDTELPVWSLANIGGVRLQEFAPMAGKTYRQDEMDALFVQVRDAAYEIIKRKGSTYYAIGLGLVSIVEAIVGDYRSVLSVSTLMTGQHGVSDICLSLPCVVGAGGVEEVLSLNLSGAEAEGFRASAQKLKTTLMRLDQ